MGDQAMRGGIRSLEKGLGVLRALQHAGEALRLSEIARRCGMSPSMVHGYLVSLVRTGFVRQDRLSGVYDLGDAALQLGLTALGQADFLQFARATMAELLEALDQTVTLSVWSEHEPVVVDKLEGRRDSVYEIRAGSAVKLWPTATGRVFMAFLPQELWSARLEEMMKCEGLKAADIAAFKHGLGNVRASGFAVTLPATVPDFSAIAAPVFDHQEVLKGVITVLGRADGFDVTPGGENVAVVKRATGALSARLGAPENYPAAGLQ